MKKFMKYILGTLAILLVLFFSLDIRKLDEYKLENDQTTFDAVTYTNEVWSNKIPVVSGKAPEITALITLLESDRERAFTESGKKLGISKTWYFMTRGKGSIDSVGNESVRIKLSDERHIQLAPAFIFGNAVREGSGVVSIDDFINMTDFNNVSVALNKKVKDEIIPVLKKNGVPGKQLEFAGAFEVNEESVDLKDITVIPVSVKFDHAE